jgi:hypothetical protein
LGLMGFLGPSGEPLQPPQANGSRSIGERFKDVPSTIKNIFRDPFARIVSVQMTLAISPRAVTLPSFQGLEQVMLAASCSFVVLCLKQAT